MCQRCRVCVCACVCACACVDVRDTKWKTWSGYEGELTLLSMKICYRVGVDLGRDITKFDKF